MEKFSRKFRILDGMLIMVAIAIVIGSVVLGYELTYQIPGNYEGMGTCIGMIAGISLSMIYLTVIGRIHSRIIAKNADLLKVKQ